MRVRKTRNDIMEKEHIHPVEMLMETLLSLDNQTRDGNGYIMDNIINWLGDHKCCEFCKNKGSHDHCGENPDYDFSCEYFEDKRKYDPDHDPVHFYRMLLHGENMDDVCDRLGKEVGLLFGEMTNVAFIEYEGKSEIHDKSGLDGGNQIAFRSKGIRVNRKLKSYCVRYRLQNGQWIFHTAFIFYGNDKYEFSEKNGDYISQVAEKYKNLEKE